MKYLITTFLCFVFVLKSYPQESKSPDKFVNVSAILKNISEPKFREYSLTVKLSDIKKEDCNDFINKKIELCSKAGGGKIILTKGEYFCKGSIFLKSNINLHLEEGVRLVFSQNPFDYLPVVLVRWEGTDAFNYSPFIYANGAENIAITGTGIIDGNGTAENSFRDWRRLQSKNQNNLREMGKNNVSVEQRVFGEGHYLRPQLIHFVNCNNILIEGVTVTNGAFWLIQPTYCNNITVREITVESRFINNDGVDVDSDSNVLIENCIFNTGDDFVAIKSGRDQDGWRVNKQSKNIIVRNCTSEECLHGISFGSEISGGIENVYAENLQFKKIKQLGLQFKSNKDRGGFIKNIVVTDVKMDTCEVCISFTNQYHSYSCGNSPSLFENIKIKNVECEVATNKAVSMEGLPEMPIQNVEFENVNVNKSRNSSSFINIRGINWVNVAIFENSFGGN